MVGSPGSIRNKMNNIVAKKNRVAMASATLLRMYIFIVFAISVRRSLRFGGTWRFTKEKGKRLTILWHL
jgi:hypothetical protein